MFYLNEKDISQLGINWRQTIDNIKETVLSMANHDFVQPIKPYLRYKNKKNRIIAMPAYVGEPFNVSGLKWISSFPDNVKQGIPRADSITILNNADTGKVESIVYTPLISIIRTVSVSGLLLQLYLKHKQLNKIRLGIIGWGPIGQYHYQMCRELLREILVEANIYDLQPKKVEHNREYKNLNEVQTWEEAYQNADIFITCTASDYRYIHIPPKKGSLLLNISLRDFQPQVFPYIQRFIVDDWEEVCRENTDIELFHKEKGLKKEECMTLIDVVANDELKNINPEETIMFNPMGMAAFDISTAAYYSKMAKERGIGQRLDK